MRHLLSTTLLAAVFAIQPLCAAPIPAECYKDGLAIGCQAYTFKEFSAFEAIAKTKEAGGTVIELFPGQRLRPDSPKTETTNHNAPDEVIQALKAECARLGIRPVNYGVVAAKNADDIRKIMEFAKKLELYSVCTESAELVAEWEKAAIEFDIKVAFHEHGGSMARPDYKVWHPLYIRGVVESRDSRVGACADLGHWCTSELKPVECLRILKGRVVSVHLKDKSEPGKQGVVVPAGKGVVDVPACIAELKAQNFNGHISIEHENDWKDNVPQVRESIEFARTHWSKAGK
jgi:sugar phosphate isomerase/epimerase